MTLTEKLNRRMDRAERYREDAMRCFRVGLRMQYVYALTKRYAKAARLVDLTAQRVLEERGR